MPVRDWLHISVKFFFCQLTGRLEETEEELVQLKIERETDRQRKVKYGAANGAAVTAVSSGAGEEEGGREVREGEDKSGGEQGWYCYICCYGKS